MNEDIKILIYVMLITVFCVGFIIGYELGRWSK